MLRAIVTRLGGDTGLSGTGLSAALARRLLVPLEYATEEAADAAAGGDEVPLSDEVQAVIFGKEQRGLQRLLGRVARTAWSARDRLSLDTWRAIYALTTWDPRYEPAGGFDGTGARAYLDMLIRRAAALSGLSAENMTRGNNWLFFDLGRRIERTFSACSLVRYSFAQTDERESASIQVALEIADSAMTYWYRYRNAFQAAPAIDLLLLDQSNPRAAAFGIDAIAAHGADFPLITDVQKRREAVAIVDEAQALMRAADAYVLAETNVAGERPALIALLDAIEDAMTRAATAIGDAYLQHLPRFAV
jgi:uncharacterized alpha-E superfamily protein